ncbi:unnamed protein product [Hermetia illucens]|uniref:Cytochrome P450 n=1 Tax=Hermetia illucens TaxID=343691 RepID=A0A7R8UEZ6_HERIL|nr:cytochrome P450 6A1-like [Hermetia illucens]CAD7079494.1 unnamed protein product [Hermetia illucens]
MDCLSIACSVVIVLITFAYLFIKRRYSFWKNRGVEYLEPSFPLGNIPFKKIHFTQYFVDVLKFKQKSSLIGAYLVTKPVAVPIKVDLIQNILVKDFASFHDRGAYVNEVDDPLSAHMFNLDGEKWKAVRTKLSPTFTSGKMKFMFPTVVEVAERFNHTLADLIKTESEIELVDLLERFTTDVIGSCAFGIECNSLQDPKFIFRHYGKKVTEVPLLRHLFVLAFPSLARKVHMRVIDKNIADFFIETVRKTIDYREKNHIRRNDFMDLLIEINKDSDNSSEPVGTSKKLSLEDMAAQAFLFFVAGFETSSATMVFCLYELALNLDIQEKCRQEINGVLEKYNGNLTYEAIKEMTYLDQTIKETLRKYPPIGFLIRKAVRDYPVPNTKIVIEKGMEVFIPLYAIHHDPEIYPNPENFEPDRFSPEEVKNRHSGSFLAFGDGPRNCVGQRFAKMQTRIGLTTLLKNYRFKTCGKTPVPMVFEVFRGILSPKGSKLVLEIERV